MCLDQMGPESAKSFPGVRLVRALPEGDRPAERARQEVDYGRRGKGYIFGAFKPADGAALTAPYDRRTIANWVDFLERVDAWLPPEAEPVYGILDNLNVHRATDVLLFSLAHPRWEFVFQPTYAAYLNLIEWRPTEHRGVTWRAPTARPYHHRAPGTSAGRAGAAGGAPVPRAGRAALGDRAAGWQPTVRPRLVVHAPGAALGEPRAA